MIPVYVESHRTDSFHLTHGQYHHYIHRDRGRGRDRGRDRDRDRTERQQSHPLCAGYARDAEYVVRHTMGRVTVYGLRNSSVLAFDAFFREPVPILKSPSPVQLLRTRGTRMSSRHWRDE